jgi:hypothetical protein
MDDTCSLDGCGRPRYARGFCEACYVRLRRQGKLAKLDDRTLEERFWDNVAPGRDPEACWLWLGRTADGYGYMSFRNVDTGAHRISLFLATGVFPQRLTLHSCDNPPCVNPNHLREGSYQDNTKDRIDHGNRLLGEKHHRAILTEENVREIRALSARGTTQIELGLRFGVTKHAIYRVIHRKTWAHVV